MNSKKEEDNKLENSIKESDSTHKELSDDELDKVVGGVSTVNKDGVNCLYFQKGTLYASKDSCCQIYETVYVPVGSTAGVRCLVYNTGLSSKKPKDMNMPSNHTMFKDCYYKGKISIYQYIKENFN